MKLRKWLAAVSGLGLFCGMEGTPAAVIYTENFLNGTGAVAAMSTVGWLGNHGSGGTSYNAASSAGDNPQVNAGVGSGTTNGFLRMSSALGVDEPVLLWTPEIQTALAPVNELSTISFFMRNQLATADVRLALQVGSAWFVTTTVYNTATTTWLQQTVDLSNATWNSLDFTSGSSLVMGASASLPTSGMVNGIGFFTANKPNAYLSFDDLSVNAVPEPSTVLLSGLAGLFLLRWNGRRRLS